MPDTTAFHPELQRQLAQALGLPDAGNDAVLTEAVIARGLDAQQLDRLLAMVSDRYAQLDEELARRGRSLAVASAQLTESQAVRQQMLDAVDALDVGVLMFGSNDRLVICNPKYREWHRGYAHALVPGTPHVDVMRAIYRSGLDDPSDLSGEPQWLERRMNQYRSLQHGPQVREVGLDGRWFRIDDSRTPGGVTVSLRTEITDARMVLQEIERARDQAQAASLAKTRFLANMSHELRTPLNAVIGAAQLIKSGAGDVARRAHLVDAIESSGTHLLDLIENILDLSRIEAGELRLFPEDFHLPDCIEAAVATAALPARAKGLDLTCFVEPDLAPWRHGDAARLRQILVNLLGNAVKFTASGQIVVRARTGAEPDQVEFEISDTGMGIETELLAHLFEPFRQAEDAANRRFGGTGLGLAIVHQLVQAMGGQIAVQSKAGAGSRFTLSLTLTAASTIAPEPAPPGLPLPYADPQPARTGEGLAMRTEKRALPATTWPQARGHVLVVEDDPLNQAIVCEMLSHAGFRVGAASSGNAALELLATHSFDLVLMDLQMPDLDGLEVTRRLRAGLAGSLGRTVPVVALTANAFAEDREACLAAGMDDFLSKPVLATRLIAVIEHHLHSARRAGASTHGLRTGDPHPGSGALPVFDPSMLASLPMVADGSQPEFATHVLQQFVKLVPRVLSSMADALQRGDGTTLQRDLHTLKSSAATIGAPALAHMAENAESGLRAGNAPTPDHVLQLQRCFDELIQELQQRGATPSAKGIA